MAIHNRRQYFWDSIIELVGIRSGLSIAHNDIWRLLQRASTTTSEAFWTGHPDEWVAIDFGEFQDDFIKLLYSIGVLGDPRPIEALAVEFARRHVTAFPDDEDGWLPLPKIHNVVQDVNRVVVRHVVDNSPLPDLFKSLAGIDELVRDIRMRHIWNDAPVDKPWDGTASLSALFETEEVFGAEGTYFDQRYIDYLAAQPVDLTRIHWRKFEQLTAEYFRRAGYQIQLGPGRDDGGVDVLAERMDAAVGPSLVVVQCRRYGESKPVGLDAVRAFWATIGDQSATKGLIATTSRLTRGARDYCNARRYRLSSADGANVRDWLGRMASPNARRT